jgi:hypothetical protein
MMNSVPDPKRNKDIGAPGNGGRFAGMTRDESQVALAAVEAHWIAGFLNKYDGIDVDAQWVSHWLPEEPYLSTLIEEYGIEDGESRDELFRVLTSTFLGREPVNLSHNGWADQHRKLVDAIAKSEGRAS